VLKWHKQEGDKVEEEDLMCDVSSTTFKGAKGSGSTAGGSSSSSSEGESHLMPFAKVEGGDGSTAEFQVKAHVDTAVLVKNQYCHQQLHI
jgi:hypothetical protein